MRKNKYVFNQIEQENLKFIIIDSAEDMQGKHSLLMISENGDPVVAHGYMNGEFNRRYFYKNFKRAVEDFYEYE